jgi:hypothetical protein
MQPREHVTSWCVHPNTWGFSWMSSVPPRNYGTSPQIRPLMTLLHSQSQSQSQSYITTDSQSVSMSWRRAQSGTFDQRYIFFFKVTVLSFGGALSDERSGLLFVSLLSIHFNSLYIYIYIYTIPAHIRRLHGPILSYRQPKWLNEQ